MRWHLLSHPKRSQTAAAITALIIMLWVGFLAGCEGVLSPSPTFTPIMMYSSASATVTLELLPTYGGDGADSPAWEGFAGPILTPFTPIPVPMPVLDIPAEVKTLLLMGTTQNNAPYAGRSQAMLLIFYHPRLGRASLFSIPADMLAYLPGFSMQRLQVAYPIGGFEQLANSLAYNLGVHLDHYALINGDTFQNYVDTENGVYVNILQDYPRQCGGLHQGMVKMDGPKALCYVSFRQGLNEIDRNVRQQQVFYQLFMGMAQGGHLASLRYIYPYYQPIVATDLTLEDLTSSIPLALRVADPGHMGMYVLSQNDLRPYLIPGRTDRTIFVVNPDALHSVLQQALDFVLEPMPASERLATLEYELTISPTVTITPTFTVTPTRTLTLTRTETPVPSVTRTRTITLTRTITRTRTITPTRTDTRTPTRTLTETP
jgi:polyisoprenyl-teichoic acid--peptidoglycan teichoic acid transferase